MLNLNYNINNSLSKQCIGVLKYNYSASIDVRAGGGGGASSGANPGGGGGAGCGVTQSISIVPNVIYQINVGAGGIANAKGQNTTFFGFDDNDTKPISALLEGGFEGTTGKGGDSGTGSYTTVLGTTNINNFTGSNAVQTSISGQFFVLAGGGAGRNANGVNPIPQNKSGNGGLGGGGGGGASRQANVNAIPGGGGLPGGGDGGGVINASAGTNGGGGGGAATTGGGTTPAAGGDGIVIISYTGKTKAFVTGNVTTAFNSSTNTTTHTFASGSGTFVYTFPFPYEELVTPYQQLLCPPLYKE